MQREYALVQMFCAALVVVLLSTLLPSPPANAQAFPEAGILYSIRPRGGINPGKLGALTKAMGGQGVQANPDVRAQARHWLNREPAQDELYLYAALVSDANKDTNGFFAYMNAACKLAPYKWQYRTIRADKYKALGRKQYALTNYQTAARIAEQYDKALAPLCNKWASDMLGLLGRTAEAERAYEKSLAQYLAYDADIKARAQDERSRKTWANARANANNQLAAIKKKLAKTRPTSAWLSREFDVDMPDSGLNPIRCLAAVELAPRDPQAWRSVGDAYLRQGRLAEAANAYTRASELGDESCRALAGKARAAAERFRPGKH